MFTDYYSNWNKLFVNVEPDTVESQLTMFRSLHTPRWGRQISGGGAGSNLIEFGPDHWPGEVGNIVRSGRWDLITDCSLHLHSCMGASHGGIKRITFIASQIFPTHKTSAGQTPELYKDFLTQKSKQGNLLGKISQYSPSASADKVWQSLLTHTPPSSFLESLKIVDFQQVGPLDNWYWWSVSRPVWDVSIERTDTDVCNFVMNNCKLAIWREEMEVVGSQDKYHHKISNIDHLAGTTYSRYSRYCTLFTLLTWYIGGKLSVFFEYDKHSIRIRTDPVL